MKPIFQSLKQDLSYKNIIKNINFLFFTLLVFWLPFNKKILPYFIGLWILTWLLEGNFVKKFTKNITNKQILFIILLPVLFYITHIIGYFYSSNKVDSSFDLQVKLSLFIFPFIFLSANSLYKKYGRTILKSFVIGNLIASILCITNSLINSINIENGDILLNFARFNEYADQSFFLLVGNRVSWFSYIYISKFLHPSYFSMYLILGIVISYYLYKTSNHKNKNIIYPTIVSVFYIMVYFLSSRAGLLSLFTTIIFLTIVELNINKHYLLILFISFTMNYGLYKAMTVSVLKTNVKEFKEGKEEKEEPGLEKEKQKDDRLLIWTNALLIIKDNIFVGVGNGDVKDNLMLQYKKNNFTKGLKNKYNSHNQYLESIISGGLINLSILLTLLLSLFYYSIKKKHLILGMFVFLIGFNFLFESMLNTISGVVFVAIFSGFLIIYTPPKLISNKLSNNT